MGWVSAMDDNNVQYDMYDKSSGMVAVEISPKPAQAVTAH
jgi:hypothetical protein